MSFSFLFFLFFLFNLNRCRTMVATTLPLSPHTHTGTDCTNPVASATHWPRHLNVLTPALVTSLTLLQPPTWTVAAPTAAAGPTPARKHSDMFFFLLIST